MTNGSVISPKQDSQQGQKKNLYTLIILRANPATKSSPSNNQSAVASTKKSPFAGLVCVTTDENGISKTERVVQSPKTKPRTLDDNDENKDAKDKDAATMRPQDKFKQNLGKTT